MAESHQIQTVLIAFLSSLLSLNNKQSKSGSGSNRRLAQEFIMAILQPPVQPGGTFFNAAVLEKCFCNTGCSPKPKSLFMN